MNCAEKMGLNPEMTKTYNKYVNSLVREARAGIVGGAIIVLNSATGKSQFVPMMIPDHLSPDQQESEKRRVVELAKDAATGLRADFSLTLFVGVMGSEDGGVVGDVVVALVEVEKGYWQYTHPIDGGAVAYFKGRNSAPEFSGESPGIFGNILPCHRPAVEILGSIPMGKTEEGQSLVGVRLRVNCPEAREKILAATPAFSPEQFH